MNLFLALIILYLSRTIAFMEIGLKIAVVQEGKQCEINCQKGWFCDDHIQNGKVCGEDQARSADGNCIPLEKCINGTCRENERIEYICPGEELKCRGVTNRTGCKGHPVQCECNYRHARNDEGRCVKYEKCPIKCSANESIYDGVIPTTEATCQNGDALTDEQLELRCICNVTYARDANGNCVSKRDCPNIFQGVDRGIKCTEELVEKSPPHTAYYFDNDTEQCLAFKYKGCGGNINRFSSLDECEAVFGRDISNITITPNCTTGKLVVIETAKVPQLVKAESEETEEEALSDDSPPAASRPLLGKECDGFCPENSNCEVNGKSYAFCCEKEEEEESYEQYD